LLFDIEILDTVLERAGEGRSAMSSVKDAARAILDKLPERATWGTI
jgi:hypothetical protein